MQQHRRSWRQNAEHAQDDQGAVEPDDKPVVSVDPLHQCIAQPFGIYQARQIVRGDRNICDLFGDRCAAVDGDAHVRFGQGRRTGLIYRISYVLPPGIH